MTKLFVLALMATLAGIPALAEDFESASSLVNLKVEMIDGQAKVLKRNQRERSERILVGIPAEVTLPDGCTRFVGQESRTMRLAWFQMGYVIRARGAKDMTADVCAAVAPSPIRVHLIVAFDVRSGHDGVSTRYIQIGKHLYRARLSAGRDAVTITKVIR